MGRINDLCYRAESDPYYMSVSHSLLFYYFVLAESKERKER